jgi:hypothetical protein
MALHKAEIAGFDNRKPTMIQVDMLTKGQIVEAFKSF